ncbi:MAG TPA: hypothetical protein DCQ43_08065 [Treponema sp.]|nr:hypothetical protein [Treponema sp.]
MRKKILALSLFLLSVAVTSLPADTYLQKIDSLTHQIEQATEQSLLYSLYEQRAQAYALQGLINEAYEDFYTMQFFITTEEEDHNFLKIVTNFLLWANVEEWDTVALQMANEYVKSFPDDEFAYWFRSRAECRLGQVDKALADYEQIMRLTSEYGDAFECMMGWMEVYQYFETENEQYKQRALNHLANAKRKMQDSGVSEDLNVTLDGFCTEFFNCFAQILFEEGDPISGLERISLINPSAMDSLFFLALAYYYEGDYVSCNRILLQMISLIESGCVNGVPVSFGQKYLQFYIACLRICVSQYYVDSPGTPESLKTYHYHSLQKLLNALHSPELGEDVTDIPLTVDDVHAFLSRKEICRRWVMCYWEERRE